MKIAMLSFLFGCSLDSYAQREVTGFVFDKAMGESVPGCQITIKGTNTIAVSNDEGIFSISVPHDSSILAFSCIGYLRQEIRVGKESRIDFLIEEDTMALGEVIIFNSCPPRPWLVIPLGTQHWIEVYWYSNEELAEMRKRSGIERENEKKTGKHKSDK